MKRIVILQNEVMAYRQPVYDGLAEHYEVLVVHSGAPSVGPANRYRERIIACRKTGPFFLQNPFAVREAVLGADAVVAMCDLRWPAYLLPSARPQGRYILWGHRYGAYRSANAVRDWLIKRADRILLYGPEEIERMRTRGVDPARVIVAPNTIHVPNHQDHSGGPKSSLLYVGRLQSRKGLDKLILAFSRLRGRLPEQTTLDIVGDGELMANLKALAESCHVTHHVRFHGTITDHERLSKFFESAYAYVSPGPVGLGAIHSLAYGVAVVTRRDERHGPEGEILVHEENALIYGDPEDLASTIERICTEPGLAVRLGQKAYHAYQERTLEKMLSGFHEAIEA